MASAFCRAGNAAAAVVHGTVKVGKCIALYCALFRRIRNALCSVPCMPATVGYPASIWPLLLMSGFCSIHKCKHCAINGGGNKTVPLNMHLTIAS